MKTIKIRGGLRLASFDDVFHNQIPIANKTIMRPIQGLKLARTVLRTSPENRPLNEISSAKNRRGSTMDAPL
jgi:hypothetical protein